MNTYVALPDRELDSDVHAESKQSAGVKIVRRLYQLWREYRRSQVVLQASYLRYPEASRIHRRIWRRHGALYMLMNTKLD